MLQKLFDVAFSFSGKERNFVRCVKDYLEQRGVSVFMDEDYSIEIWGNHLEKTFQYLYSGQIKYYVIFVSENYIKSKNTFFEFSAMLKNLYEKGTSEVLQILLDDTTLEFLPPIGAMKVCNYNCEQAGKLIIQKMKGESLSEIYQNITQHLNQGYSNPFSTEILMSKSKEGIYCYTNFQNPQRCYRIRVQYTCMNHFEKILVYDSFVETGNTMTFPTGIFYKNNDKLLFSNYGFSCDQYQSEITSKQLLQLINKKISQLG